MRIATIILLFFALNTLVSAGNNDFSDKEKAIIYTNSLKILRNYESVINEMGLNVVNDIEKAKSNAEELIELFINRQVLVYNDLDPSHKLSKFYEVETYSSNLILWYPDGININIDFEDAKVSELMKHEDDIYSLDIMLNKRINGNYLNETINKNSENLTFRIAFSRKNKSVDKFKIVGVRSAKSNDLIDYSKALKEVNSEELSEEELNKVYDGIKSILNDYNNFLALLGDPIEIEEDKFYYRESFTQLFESNETKVYNDLNPEPDKSLISVETYLKDYHENYPGGINNISLNLDSTEFGMVIKDNEGDFFTYAYTNKFFSGSFKGKEAYSKMSALVFKISFEKLGKAYTGYKITSVDISGSDFFTESTSGQENTIPDMAIQPVSRKGLSFSSIASYGLSSVKDQNISNLSLQNNNYEWNVKNDFGLTIGAGIQYFFTDHLGINTGILYNTFKANFNLEGSFQDDQLSLDINNDSFNKIIDANIDSTVNINYISLPVLANYIHAKPGEFGFYVEAGVIASYLISSTYNLTGDYKYSGYYPGNPEIIQYLEIEELGFYDRSNIEVTGDINVADFNLSLYGSVGVSIPFGYYSSLIVGPEIMLGISETSKDRNEYIDAFGNSSTNKATKVQKIGLKVGFVYKL